MTSWGWCCLVLSYSERTKGHLLWGHHFICPQRALLSRIKHMCLGQYCFHKVVLIKIVLLLEGGGGSKLNSLAIVLTSLPPSPWAIFQVHLNSINIPSSSTIIQYGDNHIIVQGKYHVITIEKCLQNNALLSIVLFQPLIFQHNMPLQNSYPFLSASGHLEFPIVPFKLVGGHLW